MNQTTVRCAVLCAFRIPAPPPPARVPVPSQDRREDVLLGLSVHRLGARVWSGIRRRVSGGAGFYRVRDDRVRPWLPAGAHDASVAG